MVKRDIRASYVLLQGILGVGLVVTLVLTPFLTFFYSRLFTHNFFAFVRSKTSLLDSAHLHSIVSTDIIVCVDGRGISLVA